MKNTFVLVFLFLIAISASGLSPAKTNGFVLPVYQELPAGAIRPEGWIKHQLQLFIDSMLQ